MSSSRLIPLSVLPCALAAALGAQTPDQLSQAAGALEFRPIGPAVMGGRIADLAVVESRPQTFYVGTASGGVWKTTNDGTTWEPIFDNQSTASIGDVTLAPSNPNVVWVGTGEPQNRQSSPWGDGVYKSTDGGRTWRHMGLEQTHHIGRIVIHPRNPDIVYVAAVGHLWGPNPERGVYRTMDGGATWQRVLYVDENTGAIDLVMDPGDPKTLLAAMYQRRRTGWGFNGGGPGSGIYRTLDGGDTWQEMTEGLPAGDKGRVGLDVYRRDGNLVYALVEADKRAPGAGFGGGGQGPAQSGLFRSRDRGATWERVSNTDPRPMYYSQIRIDPNNPERIYVLDTQLYVSDDGGKTFRTDLGNEVHVDRHALWVDPNDSDHLIVGSDGGVSASWDAGQHWRMFDNLPIGQFYDIGVDMRDPYYVCGGLQDNDSWCGPSRTLSQHGIRNSDWYEVWGGDGFFNVPDPTDPNIVFTESQGGFMGRYDVATGEQTRLRPLPGPRSGSDTERDYRFNWSTPIEMSPRDPATIYLGANVLLRSRDRGMTWQEISPDLTKQIDRDSLAIMGVKGSDPKMSPNDGISSYGNITTVAESPMRADLVYVGTDDGNVWVTRDGGANWTDLTKNIRGLPERTYVSRVVPSHQVEGRVYAMFDGHRNDDYHPYVFVSEDYGRRWRPLVTGLPDGWSVNVLAEHQRTPNLLFVGNEIGVYFSVDRGEHWARLKNNLPTVPVDDIVIHPRDNDLVLGTHGRSIWILPDVTPLEHLSAEVLARAQYLFPVRPVTMWSLNGDWPFEGNLFSTPNPPVAARVRYSIGASGAGSTKGDSATAKLIVLDETGRVVRSLDGPGAPGIQEVMWDLRHDAPYQPARGQRGGGGGGGFFGGTPPGPLVLPGTYTVGLVVGGDTLRTSVVVRPEPRRQLADAERQARQEALMSMYRLAKPVYDAQQRLNDVRDRLRDIQTLLRAHKDAPKSLTAVLDSLQSDVDTLRSKLGAANRDVRVSNAIEGSTTPPTADQMWQVHKASEDVPQLIEQVNAVLTDRLPGLERMLQEQGIHPTVGAPIPVPRRPEE